MGGVAGGLVAGGLLVVGVGPAVGLEAGALAAGDEPDELLLAVWVTVGAVLGSEGTVGIATCWKRPFECLA